MQTQLAVVDQHLKHIISQLLDRHILHKVSQADRVWLLVGLLGELLHHHQHHQQQQQGLQCKASMMQSGTSLISM